MVAKRQSDGVDSTCTNGAVLRLCPEPREGIAPTSHTSRAISPSPCMRNVGVSVALPHDRPSAASPPLPVVLSAPAVTASVDLMRL